MAHALSTLRPVKLVTVRRVTQCSGFTELCCGLDDCPRASWLSSNLLHQRAPDLPFLMALPVRRVGDLEWASDAFGQLSKELVDSVRHAPGLVLFYSEDLGNGPKGPGDSVRTSPLCYAPGVLAAVLRGEHPVWIHKQRLDEHAIEGFREIESVPEWLFGRELERLGDIRQTEPDPQCIICMEHPARYKWSGCGHPADTPDALVCDRCQRSVNRTARTRKQDARGHKRPVAPCPICRRTGYLQRWCLSASMARCPLKSPK